MIITPATGNRDHDAFAQLVKEYSASLSQRLASEAWFIEAVLKHQSLDSELAAIKAAYGPPHGIILLATARTARQPAASLSASWEMASAR